MVDALSEKYKHVFSHFDENKDGKISPSELQRCISATGGDISLAEAEAAVAALDADGDGLLGFEDFVELVEGGREEERVKDLREAFKMFEIDGCITPRSLRQMLGRLGESRTIDECKLMISRFDLNGDGVLNFDEFVAMMS